MSWWINLHMEMEDEICDVPSHSDGGTYAVGGTSKADLSVTYNYGNFFDFDELHGKRASDTIETLENAVMSLGDDPRGSYWTSTPGNVGHACAILLGWARLHPDAVWDVS